MPHRGRGVRIDDDRVQLTHPKDWLHTVVLEPGKQFRSHRGAIVMWRRCSAREAGRRG